MGGGVKPAQAASFRPQFNEKQCSGAGFFADGRTLAN